MRVAFIYSLDEFVSIEKPLRSPTSIPFGISCLASVLKREGHAVDVLVLTSDTPLEEAARKFIEEFKPDMWALSAVASQFNFITRVSKLLKQITPDKYQVLGGHHASLNTEDCLKEPYFDAICKGEGDNALKDLVGQLDAGKSPSGIDNMYIRQSNGNYEISPQSPFEQEIDYFPFPERDMWEKWTMIPDLCPSVLISRGCPYKCTYCANHAMARLSPGRYVRYRSPDKIVEEIRQILAKTPTVTDIYLEAETFGADLKMTFKICEALEAFNATRKRPISFSANFTLIKLVSANKELLERLQRANFTGMNVGLESGSERLRNGDLKRPPYKNEDLIEFCHRAKEHGIGVTLFALMGVPGETLADFQETIKVVRAAEPVHVYLSIFYPYPGTDLWKIAVDLDLIPENHDQGYERTKPNLDLPGFSSDQILHEYKWFYYKAFVGKWPLHRVLLRTMRQYLLTMPALNKIYAYLSDSRLLFSFKQSLGKEQIETVDLDTERVWSSKKSERRELAEKNQ